MRSARLATVHARGGRVRGATRLRKRVWAFTALHALTCVPRRRPEARRCTSAGGHHSRVFFMIMIYCHRGVLAAKVSDFGSNLLKCTRGQMGTKPAKD